MGVKITDKSKKDFVKNATARANELLQLEAARVILAELAKITCPVHGPLEFQGEGLDTDTQPCCDLTRAEVEAMYHLGGSTDDRARCS